MVQVRHIHYRPVRVDHTEPGHTHATTILDMWSGTDAGLGDMYAAQKATSRDPEYPHTASANAGIVIKADDVLTTAEETEAEAITRTSTVAETNPTVSVENVYRRNKTNLNPAVKAESAHTQMQPFIVINYIIKY